MAIHPRQVIMQGVANRVLFPVGRQSDGGLGKRGGAVAGLGLGLGETQNPHAIRIRAIVGSGYNLLAIAASALVPAHQPSTAGLSFPVPKMSARIDRAPVGFATNPQSGAGGAGVQPGVSNGLGHGFPVCLKFAQYTALDGD